MISTTKMLTTGVLAAVLAAPAYPAPASDGGTDTYAVRAARMLLADGREVEDAVLLVEGGKIRAAGRGVDVPAGVPVLEHDGVLTAGMIACHGYSGTRGETGDDTRSVLAEARIANALDLGHSDFANALAAGITTLVITPAPDNLAPGSTAVVKTAGGTILSSAAHLSLSFTDDALRANRYPTSYGGALAELDARLADPSGAFAEAVAGRLPVLFEVSSRDETQRAAEFATRHGLGGALHGARRAGEVLSAVQQSGLGVIVGPFDPGTPGRQLDSVVALGGARVPLAFGLDAPQEDGDALRLSAAMCVRDGLDPALAWQGLTSGGADIAGVGRRVGRLEAGLDADFVLWSGPPLDLTSSVVEVYVDGARVFGGVR